MAKTTNINLENLSKEELIDLYREINIMSKINHPTILQFIGYSLLNFRKKEKPVIITEYASKLTLSNINSDEDDDEIILNLNDTQKLINIYGIAIGMSYLHSHNIIHRNLQQESIFLDEHFYPKISKFNYAKEIESNTTFFESRTDSKLKVKSNYVAPEVLTSLKYSKASDVYEFAFLSYLILMEETPYFDFYPFISVADKEDHPELVAKEMLKQKWRPEFTDKIP